jgi:hypothetical protein
VWRYAPRLHLSAPIRRAGKSRVLSLLSLTAAKRLKTETVTTAALFRSVEMAQPTLLLDETNALLNDNAEPVAQLDREALDPAGDPGGQRAPAAAGVERAQRDDWRAILAQPPPVPRLQEPAIHRGDHRAPPSARPRLRGAGARRRKRMVTNSVSRRP